MKSKRQLQILEASLDLIHRKGIQGLTIKNLSKMIGISEPAIYRHFDSKIDILIAILNSFQDRIYRMEQLIKDDQTNELQKIVTIFSSHFKEFNSTPALASVIFSEEIFSNETVLKKKVFLIIQQNQEMFRKIIEGGQKKGLIRNDIQSNYLTIMIMGSLRLHIKSWLFSSYDFDLIYSGDKIIEMIIKLIKNENSVL